MSNYFICLILVALSIDSSIASGKGHSTPATKLSFVAIGSFDQCDGKDAANYTYIFLYTQDAACTLSRAKLQDTDYLINCAPNEQKIVNEIRTLARSDYPAGAYVHQETLYLGLSGNLAGKYVYIKEIGTLDAYLKKCSSVLGNSYISAKSVVLLIAEKLDLNVLLSPNGGYEPFKRSAQTVCNGRLYGA